MPVRCGDTICFSFLIYSSKTQTPHLGKNEDLVHFKNHGYFYYLFRILEYGCMLEIKGVRIFPDGSSVVNTVGISRFRVLSHFTETATTQQTSSILKMKRWGLFYWGMLKRPVTLVPSALWKNLVRFLMTILLISSLIQHFSSLLSVAFYLSWSW